MTRLAHCLVAVALAMGISAGTLDQLRAWVAATDLPPLAIDTAVEVLDRNGDLLRAYTVADGRWRMAVTLEGVDRNYVAALIAYEDKRFYDHGGVDLIAMSRAFGQALWNRGVVSGGSTLTMQVARLLEDGSTGTLSGKLRQIRVAWALEARFSKDEILTLYLNRAPFGGNIEGVRAASYAWLGKPPTRLTPAEAALMVALPQSPERRRPDRNPLAANAARDQVLTRVADALGMDQSTLIAAKTESISAQRVDFPAFAPHLADRVLADSPTASRHQLTIDRALQIQIEALAQTTVAPLGDRIQIAVLVGDHQSGEILASVGSAGFQADQRQGFVDMTQALRSPGSTLKPLIYGLAFDQGMAHPETLIADQPVSFDGYAPQNFDGQFRGDVRVRDALQMSLNIPVVSILDAMGPQHLIAGLRRAGVQPEVPGGRAGLAVGLGGVGVTLQDIVQLYAGIANGGEAVDLRWNRDEIDQQSGQTILGNVAAWQVADILLETPRPRGVMGSGVAFKTGTSYGHRDAWAVGFDGRHVVGVWMGRPDGTPVPGAFGGDLAAPVLFATFERLKSRIDPIAPPPPATLLVSNAQLPLPLQRFRPRGQIIAATGGPQIVFPPDGAIIDGTQIIGRISDGHAPFTWLANGAPVATTQTRQLDLTGLGAGFSSLTVIDAQGLNARAVFELR
ncbi:penicillin-binding protein 1C [Octadecabacter sp. R77987]|uniref:penicillin-binding protein 1C n=1 Tax=Octadecabacter sp. R77987 TaxID=3093874 RepID=UPI00366CCAC5